MSSSSDLIDYFKLDTKFYDEYVLHTSPSTVQRHLRIEKRWYTRESIGQGSFGTVRLEVNGEDIKERRAVKVLSKDNMKYRKIDYKRELLALAKLSKFTNVVVEFYGWFEDEDRVFLAMEYFPHGDLGKYVTTGMTEDDAIMITHQLLEGLTVMHGAGFTHRDLKPQNIFVLFGPPAWWVKIGDFGITKRIENEGTSLRTNLGTEHFKAPEICGFIDDIESSEYTSAVDIWSLGCVTYTLLAQKVPFSDSGALSKFCGGSIPFPATTLSDKGVRPEFIWFLKESLMVPQPAGRWTAKKASQDPLFHEAREAPSVDYINVANERVQNELVQRRENFEKELEKEFEKRQKEFCRAVEDNDEDRVSSLLELGVEPDRVEEYFPGGKRALWMAAKSGHAGIVKLLIESGKGVDINAPSNNHGELAIHEAAIYGNEDVARVLLDNGAILNQQIGWSPLHEASAFFGREGLIKLFLDRGANIESRTEGDIGATPLHLASCRDQQFDRAVVFTLLRAGANIHALDKEARTPERRAYEYGRTEAVEILREWRNEHT